MALVWNPPVFMTKGQQDEDLGAGSGWGEAVLIATGVSALIACLLTLGYAIDLSFIRREVGRC